MRKGRDVNSSQERSAATRGRGRRVPVDVMVELLDSRAVLFLFPTVGPASGVSVVVMAGGGILLGGLRRTQKLGMEEKKGGNPMTKSIRITKSIPWPR